MELGTVLYERKYSENIFHFEIIKQIRSNVENKLFRVSAKTDFYRSRKIENFSITINLT